MSQYCIYIQLPDYLAQWLKHEFWNNTENRVVMPKNSVENLLFEQFLKMRPKFSPPEVNPNDGSIPIKVPTFSGLNPDSFNYMTDAGRKALVGAIRRRFRRMLRSELDGFYSSDLQIMDIIIAFCEKHGIAPEEKNWEAVRQMYYRMRKEEKKHLKSSQECNC